MRLIARFFGFVFTTGAILFGLGALVVAGLGWHYSKDLPDYTQLRNYEPPVMTRVHAADGSLQVRGLFVGDDTEVFNQAAALSLQVNFEMLEAPLPKVVVYLDPAEFKSTWLGNKAVYRTRMAMADRGELLILAPGLKEFGEDHEIDRLIRKYGYFGTPRTLAATKANAELQQNLGAAAHLIHGSSEDRFSITYCPGHLTRAEIEGVGFQYADLKALTARYDPAKLVEGPNTLPDGEKIFYISNPALGLWAYRGRFSQ